MSEWKRIFLDPRRMGLLVLLTLLCAGLFLATQPGSVEPDAFARLWEANQYTASLTKQWQDAELNELPGLIEGEKARLDAVDSWYSAHYWDFIPEEGLPFSGEDEALASIADIPFLVAAAHESPEEYMIASSYLWQPLLALDEQIQYLLGYPAYLDHIQTQAQQQSQASIFGVEGSFSRRNLQKTAEDFNGLRGVEVSFGISRGIEQWLSFGLGDFFHLIGVVLFVMAFLEERKKGLWSIVRTCRGGRLSLGSRRVGILAAGSALCTLLFCGIPLAISLGFYGGWQDLGRSLQSVASFQACTLRVTVGTWLLRFFFVKTAAGMFIGLLLWCLLGSITNIRFSVSVLGVVLTIEYALYALLPVQSALNVVKYLNIFSYVHTSALYTAYLNVDLLGFPVGIRGLVLWVLPVLGVLLAGWAVCIQGFRRPEGNRDWLSKAALVWNRGLDFFRTRLSLGLWEAYKTLILSCGVLLLLLIFLGSQRLSYLYYTPTSTDVWYTEYLADMEGPIDDTTDDYLASAREYAAMTGDHQQAAAISSALDRLEREVETLRSRAGAGGYTPWLVDPTPYDMVYSSKCQSVQRLNAAVAVVCVALCCAGLGAYERQSGMVYVLRSLKRGRGGLFGRKVIAASLLAAYVWAVVYMRELAFFGDYFMWPETLAAPVQNLNALSAFPLPVSFAQYLILLYAIRLMMLVVLSWVVLLLSQLSPTVQTAYLLSIGVLGMPALLLVFGADGLKWISPIIPVASAELLWDLGSNGMNLLPWLAWLAVGSGCLWFSRRRWTRIGASA